MGIGTGSSVLKGASPTGTRWLEQQLKEHGEKIPSEERGKVEAAINNVREALKGDDVSAIKKAGDALMTEAQTIGKIVYEEMAKQTAQSAAAPEGAGPADGGDSAPQADDVIDAEFEVKDAK